MRRAYQHVRHARWGRQREAGGTAYQGKPCRSLSQHDRIGERFDNDPLCRWTQNEFRAAPAGSYPLTGAVLGSDQQCGARVRIREADNIAGLLRRQVQTPVCGGHRDWLLFRFGRQRRDAPALGHLRQCHRLRGRKRNTKQRAVRQKLHRRRMEDRIVSQRAHVHRPLFVEDDVGVVATPERCRGCRAIERHQESRSIHFLRQFDAAGQQADGALVLRHDIASGWCLPGLDDHTRVGWGLGGGRQWFRFHGNTCRRRGGVRRRFSAWIGWRHRRRNIVGRRGCRRGGDGSAVRFGRRRYGRGWMGPRCGRGFRRTGFRRRCGIVRRIEDVEDDAATDAHGMQPGAVGQGQIGGRTVGRDCDDVAWRRGWISQRDIAIEK